ncbi:MAG: PD-(D/E)XK nuclease family protein [Clostridia bacterium]|nr:PD-(D/E)XK nuclease family protein [Clostridia bacterium]
MIKITNVKSLYSALYQAVEFCKENEKENIEIIVPDKLSLFMEKFLFEHMGIDASFNIKVSTLNRFAKKSCFVEKEKQISKVGSILLIHKILNDNFDKLEVLRNRAYSFSYAEDIFKTITQLKASKIDWKEMKNFSSTNDRLLSKIKDLAIVYEQYELGKSGLLDSSDLFLMSTLTVAKGKENSKLLFVGFDDFTAIEYAIIEQLACVAEVNVLNYHSKENNKFLYNSEIISQLKNIAMIKQLPLKMETKEVETSEFKKFLECNLYALTKNQFELEKDIVKVYAGTNSVDEIEYVARDIRARILNGTRFDDFGVAVFNLENNANKIKEIFEKYEINYYLDSEIVLTKSVLYKFFASVLRYNLEGYNLSNLIDIINSPFFKLEKEKKREIVQKLVAVNLHGKITNQLNLQIDDELKSCLVDFVHPLIFEKTIDAKSLIEKLKELDKKLNFDEVLTELANDDLKNKILLNKSKEIIFNLFEEILKFNIEIDTYSFFDIFTHVVGVVKINNLPLSLDVVKIVDANNSMEIFNELYVLGASHENAPSLKYDCGIILDTEIEKLNFKNKLSPTISHINKLAKLRLFNTCLLFENELTLTYSNSQSDIVKEFINKFQVETEEGIINIVPISKFDFDKYVVMTKWDAIEYSSKNKINLKNIKNTEKIKENNEKIIKNKDFSQISNNNLNIFDDFKNISATTLENYFKCPFYAFMNNILKISPRLETEILSLDIGNVLHEIMFKYYENKKQVGDIYEFCKNEVFKYADKVERLKLNLNSPILVNLIDEAVRVINAMNYIDENSLFEPSHFEFAFNGANALKLKNISIIGKVDRVDTYNDMFRIIDYKSGKADASLKELYYGNKLQLFLYSLAMENVLKKKGVGTFYMPLHNKYEREVKNPYSLKGFYLAEDFVVNAFDRRLEAGAKSDIVNVKINKKNTVTRTLGYKELNSVELVNLKNYSKEVSENAVDEIKSGYIAPSPSDVSKPCEYCPYVHVCMKDCNGLDYRKSSRIDLSSFKESEDEGV